MISFGGVETVVCLGAHADDIEIGAGGTLLYLAQTFPMASFTFFVFSANEERAAEAKASAVDLLPREPLIEVGRFSDGLLPYEDAADVKTWLATRSRQADIVLSPSLDDRHQDHRFVAELAWQTYRRTPILEYEIPKWEGDRPECNFFVPLDDEIVERKKDHLARNFPSQHDKPWYAEGLFESVLRLRGMEAGCPFAEAFTVRKVVLGSALSVDPT